MRSVSPRRLRFFFFVAVAGKSRLHLTNARLNTPFCCCPFVALCVHTLPLTFYMRISYGLCCCCYCVLLHLHKFGFIVVVGNKTPSSYYSIVCKNRNQQNNSNSNKYNNNKNNQPHLIYFCKRARCLCLPPLQRRLPLSGSVCVTWQICLGRCKPT